MSSESESDIQITTHIRLTDGGDRLSWTAGDGSQTTGYDAAYYFADGAYLGPDRHGIEPVFPVRVTLDEDGVYVAECPALPGCVSQGATRETALENLRAAIGAVA